MQFKKEYYNLPKTEKDPEPKSSILQTEVKLRRNPACPLCGDNPTVTELIDYEIFCGLTAPETQEVVAVASD